jgi:hypothetical protein
MVYFKGKRSNGLFRRKEAIAVIDRNLAKGVSIQPTSNHERREK